MPEIPLHLWPDTAIEAIRSAALAILERAGIRVDSAAARETLLRAGCRPGPGERLSVPPEVVATALEACPGRYALAARDEARTLEVDPDPGATYVHNLGGARDMIDVRTGIARRATVADQASAARVMHQLVNQHSVTSLVQPGDVPDLLEPLYSFLVLARETDKPIGGPGISTALQAEVLADMATALTGATGAGETYPIDLAFSPVSPLQLGAEVTDALVGAVRRGGVVVEILPCPSAGSTAPGSLVGALASQHAEVLAGVVLVEALAPGTPVYSGPRLSAINPRTGMVTSGTPETGVASAAATLLARRDGLACDCYGLTSDAVVVDAQFGFERMVNTIVALGARPRFLSGIGEAQGGVGGWLEGMVIDDEILNYAFYALGTRPCDEEALDVDAIVEGALSEYGFLATRHTQRFLRTDFLRPLLSYRGTLGDWMAAGRGGIEDLASERVQRLLAAEPVGLPEDVSGELCALIDGAARRAGLVEWPDPRRIVDA